MANGGWTVRGYGCDKWIGNMDIAGYNTYFYPLSHGEYGIFISNPMDTVYIT